MNESSLVEWLPWLRRTARAISPPEYADDVIQEGWIAIWRAHEKYNGSINIEQWQKIKARYRMREVIRAMLREDITCICLAKFPDIPEKEPPPAKRIDLENALDQLTPNQRCYVIARFWEGMKTGELIEYFGTEPSSLWRGARKKLRKSLTTAG